MKKFLIISSIVFIKQFIFLISFCTSIYYHDYDSIIISCLPCLVLFLYLVLHFKYSKRIYNKINLTEKLFYVYSFITWILNGALITYLILVNTYIYELLPKAPVFLSGVEYIFVPILLSGYLIILCILKLLMFIIELIKTK